MQEHSRDDSGTATQTPTGRYVNLWPEYTISVSGLNVSLTPGTYWLNVSALVGNDPATGGYLNSYASITTGANAVGTPPGNNPSGLQDWTDSYAPFLNSGFDFSMGIAGTAVPEPSAGLVLLAGGSLFVLMRRSRKR